MIVASQVRSGSLVALCSEAMVRILKFLRRRASMVVDSLIAVQEAARPLPWGFIRVILPYMRKDKLPYSDSDDDVIAPDVAPRHDQPLDPAEAVRLEEEKYADSSADENRDDELDAHHADQDDVV